MSSATEQKRTFLSDKHHDSTWSKVANALHAVRWRNVLVLVVQPIYGFLQVSKVPLHHATFVWSLVYFIFTIGSITTGYHRLWAHRSYSASAPLRWFLAAFGAGAMQNSILSWARDHRAHHRYTDTDRDPYTISKGFWHAHILWMLVQQPKVNDRVDISDLLSDRLVMLQYAYYGPTAVFMGWVFPTLVASLWGDPYGGLLYAGVLRLFCTHQATFCINSIAHYIGDQPYSDRRSARNNVVTALITLGEGYHNFHHEFPSDYRNGVQWYDIDPTKWFISLLAKIGVTRDLKRFKQTEIEKSRIQQAQKKLSARSQQLSLDWGRPLNQLPVMEWVEYQAKVQAGEALVVIEGAVHDVASFSKEHPGGEVMVRSMLGKDATGLFNGGVYDHSNTARNILSTLRVAALRGGGEVESLK